MEDSGDWSESLLIRRSRLKFSGFVLNPNVAYKVELGVSNRDIRGGSIDESGNTANIILDAVVKWQFRPGWTFWAGQTKLPGNRERVISSQVLQFVDRSLVNARFNLDRDIGLQLHHSHKINNMVLRQALAVSTGEGRDIIVNNPENGHQYTFRMEFLPMGSFKSKGDYFGSDLAREPSPKLSIGIGGDYNDDTPRSRGNLGRFITDDVTNDYLTSDLASFIADVTYKHKGWSVASEYIYRTANEQVAGFGYGKGVVGSVGYLFKNNFELAGRYTQIDPVGDLTSIRGQKEYLIGFSRYVIGHALKVQGDVSYTDNATAENFYMLRMQFEVSL